MAYNIAFDNLPQSWYPIYPSRKLKRGALVPILFLGREWLLFRSECDKQAYFIDRYCPHMGIDLSNGKVFGCHVTCPMHKRNISVFASRQCCGKQSGAPCKSLVQNTQSLPTTEKYGLIFVFLGPKPLFQLPEPSAITFPIYSDPLLVRLENNYLAVSLNTFDTSHFEFIHNRSLGEEVYIFKNDKFHLGVEFTVSVKLVRWVDYAMKILGYPRSHLRYEIWGDNLAFGRNQTSKQNFLAMLAPGITEDCSYLYIIAVGERWSTNSLSTYMQHKLQNIAALFGRSFLKSDFPIIKNMKPRTGNLSEAKDKAIIEFWNHKKQLPTFSEVKHKLSWE